VVILNRKEGNKNNNKTVVPCTVEPSPQTIMSPSATVLDPSAANASVGALGTSASGKKLKIRKYPEFETLEQERQYRKQHLAAAFRVFADRGFDEGVAGHISVRDPILTDHFWLNPLSQHFATITVSDLELVNENGEVVIGDEPINAAAFAIHSEVLSKREENGQTTSFRY